MTGSTHLWGSMLTSSSLTVTTTWLRMSWKYFWLQRFPVGFITKAVEHFCVAYLFLDTELLEILTSVLILVSAYHLGVVLSFFPVVHCNLFLDQIAKVYINQFTRNTAKIDCLHPLFPYLRMILSACFIFNHLRS